VGARAGLEDDPARLRIKRQLDAFFEKGAAFDPLPVDDFQEIARVRLRELGKAMMSTRFQKLDDPRKQAFVEVFMRTKQMSGVMTAEDQAQQAQQAQQAEVEAEQAKERAKWEGKMASDAANKQAEMEIERMKSTGLSQQTVDGDGMPLPARPAGEPEEIGESPEVESPEPAALTAPSNLTINVVIPPTSKSVRMARNTEGGYDAVVEPMA
jgi:hypothetical protein